MIRPMPLDDDQKKHCQVLGQLVVDFIGDIAVRDELTLNVIIEMLCSVVAHYIGGIPDQALRQSVYNDFGGNLAHHLSRLEFSDAPRALVGMENEGKPN